MSEVLRDGVGFEPMADGGVPEDFHRWSAQARRAWLAGGMTQRQMLNYSAKELGLSVHFDGAGALSNRELAEFIVELTEPMVGETS